MNEYHRAMVEQSTYRRITVGILAIIIVLVGALLIKNGGFGIDPASSARTVVEEFGAQQQKVSLLEPQASSTMAEAYGPFVAPDLLAHLQADLDRAPGRRTSSPYPDHIDITTITKQGAGYIVSGSVVHMSATGESGRTPVIMQVIPHEGRWIIAAYEEQMSGRE